MAMPQEWVNLCNDLLNENGAKEVDNKFLRQIVLSSQFGPICSILKTAPLNEVLKQTLSGSYEGLDRIDFKLENNAGATAKYQIVDGHSEHPIKFADHEHGISF